MKICVVTGSRAEYGLLYWLLKKLKSDAFFELQLVVTGMHLVASFGHTYREIENDGFEIVEKLDILLASDSPVGIGKSVGLSIVGFSETFGRLRPDLLLILGDRYEVFGAASAAMLLNIPVAHLHGGEATEGLIDEAIRHAITKMSHLHFVATEEYRRRVIQLGEQQQNVYNVGALGVESAKRTQLLSKKSLEEAIGFGLTDNFFLVTYHPVTLDLADQRNGLQALFLALNRFPQFKIVFTLPNADTHGSQIVDMVREYANAHKQRVFYTASLGRVKYLSALRYCSCVIGNSSSGIIESPSFGIPSVDIGFRQKGRVRADSVIHSGSTAKEVESSINVAVALKNTTQADAFANPYDGGLTSESIVNILKNKCYDNILMKRFNDLR